MTKVVIATDVRYWRRRTGAQQRIAALVKYLSTQFEVLTFFAAPLNQTDDCHDQELIEQAGLKVVSLIDDWQPEGMLEKAKWQARCLLNAVKPNSDSASETGSRKLSDFVSPELKLRFAQLVQQHQADIVIVEYVTLGYLVPSPDQRNGVVYAIDTHDLLSSRCQQFRQHGQTHWVDLTLAEEIAVLSLFDLIIAIQATEASVFERHLESRIPVVVAGHPVERLAVVDESRDGDRAEGASLSIGYFASDNFANLDAIEWFLQNVWPAVVQEVPQTELVIAGSICRNWESEKMSADLEVGNVRLLPEITTPLDFYPRVDAVVNPIRIGTGLKIKNVEAIGFGKPLITTPHGAEGLPVGAHNEYPYQVADSAEAMVRQIIELAINSKRWEERVQAARSFAVTYLSPQHVYRSIVAAVQQAVER